PLPTPSLKGKDIMSVVREENLARLDPSGARTAMVDRSSPTRLRPGDTVRVTSHRSMTHPTSTLSFSGIILAISRRGPESTITIRNIVQQLGVEMRYPVYSPMVKAIDVLARGKGYRRAKLYYLRDQPGKTFSRVSRKAMSKQ
ncbi:translation protein SH3-like domain-containing protein, partial [Piptocephalis cylindrospora]